MSSDLLPELDRLAKEFRTAWSHRSEAEREARETEIEQAVRHRAEEHRHSIAQMLDRAAVSGAFDPRHLAIGLAGLDDKAPLDEIVRGFDRRIVADIWHWTMRASLRTPLLLRLAEDPSRLATVLDDTEALETDSPGVKLRRLLRGHRPDLSIANSDDLRPDDVRRRLKTLQEWRQALDWVESLPQHAEPAREAARSIAILQRLAECDRMLSRGFVGRGRQLKRLRQFVSAPIDTSGPIPFIQVTGIGGAGKSTLLAKLMRPAIATNATDGAIFIKIDFDRLSLRAGGEEALSFEVSRQLGLVDLSAMEQFGTIRRDQQSHSQQADGPMLETGLRSAEEFAGRALGVVSQLGLNERPVVLILDTFEEWQRPARDWEESAAAGGNIERLVEWVRGLRTQMGLDGLRIIVSGRNPVEIRDVRFRKAPKVLVGSLPLKDRRALLRSYNLRPRAIDRISRIAGGIPLSLHLAAMQLESLSASDQYAFLDSVPHVVDTIEESVRQGMLYDRFLGHVRDKDARKLAHPGLALRYVTPLLIRDVLAVPCGIGEIDLARAQQLFDLLGDEVWLVERHGDRLVHRPEVRRTMLSMMRADAKMTARIDDVHEKAAQWFGAQERPESVEQLYHQIALLPADADLPWLLDWESQDFRRLTVPGTLQGLEDAADDFAPRIGAQLNFLAGRILPEAELRHLPARSREFARDRLARSLLDLGLPEKAVTLGEHEIPEPAWYSEAVVQAGRWIPMSVSQILRLAEPSAPWRQSAIDWRYPVLREIMTSDDSDALLSMVRDVALVAQSSDASSAGLRDAIYFAAAAHLVKDGDAGILGSLVELLQYGKLDPLRASNALRSVLVSATVSRQYYFRELAPPGTFASLFRPDPESFERTIKALMPLFRSRPNANAGSFAPIQMALQSGNLTSAILLGELSREFENVLHAMIDVEYQNADFWPEAILQIASVQTDAVELPELRPAVRAAVTNAFPTKKAFLLLAGVANEVLPLVPVDFEPNLFARRASRRPRESLTRLVEFIDRAGVMAAFLDRLVVVSANQQLINVREGHARVQSQMLALQQHVDLRPRERS